MQVPCARRGRGSLTFAGLLAAAGLALIAASPQAQAFGYDDVTAQARELASRPYQPTPTAQEALAELEYDAYRDIRFRPSQSIWRADGRPLELQLSHAGRAPRHDAR